MRNCIVGILFLATALAFVCCQCGCVSATATRTQDGVTESVKVSSFLSIIKQGLYTNGNGICLSVTDASPDQQSIALLAGTVADLGKTAMLFARQPTNAPGTNTTK